jgi:hypothetical protein
VFTEVGVARNPGTKPGPVKVNRLKIGVRLALAALFFLPAWLLAADQTDTSAQVSLLLETGWKNSPGNYAAAQQQYEQAKQAAPADVRVPFAMALTIPLSMLTTGRG